MYKKQINKGEEQIKKQQQTRKELVKQKNVQPRRLARKKFEEEDIQIEESPEALGNLRKMKPLGNILVDRFKSLQKRNIVATSVRRMPRKLRLKKIKKNSHNKYCHKTIYLRICIYILSTRLMHVKLFHLINIQTIPILKTNAQN